MWNTCTSSIYTFPLSIGHSSSPTTSPGLILWVLQNLQHIKIQYYMYSITQSTATTTVSTWYVHCTCSCLLTIFSCLPSFYYLVPVYVIPWELELSHMSDIHIALFHWDIQPVRAIRPWHKTRSREIKKGRDDKEILKEREQERMQRVREKARQRRRGKKDWECVIIIMTYTSRLNSSLCSILAVLSVMFHRYIHELAHLLTIKPCKQE